MLNGASCAAVMFCATSNHRFSTFLNICFVIVTALSAKLTYTMRSGAAASFLRQHFIHASVQSETQSATTVLSNASSALCAPKVFALLARCMKKHDQIGPQARKRQIATARYSQIIQQSRSCRLQITALIPDKALLPMR